MLTGIAFPQHDVPMNFGVGANCGSCTLCQGRYLIVSYLFSVFMGVGSIVLLVSGMVTVLASLVFAQGLSTDYEYNPHPLSLGRMPMWLFWGSYAV